MTNVFSSIFKYLSISLVFSLLGLVVGNIFIPESVVHMANTILMVMMILMLILALFSRKGAIPARFSMNYVYLYTFIQGVLLYPTINYYLYDLGVGVVFSILIATIVIFGVLSLYAKKSNSYNILGFGKSFMFILIGMIIASIVNIFIGSSTISLIVSAIGVLLFSAYIIYDIKSIKIAVENSYIKDKNDLSIHVLNLYMDFINLLLDILNIASKLDD